MVFKSSHYIALQRKNKLHTHQLLSLSLTLQLSTQLLFAVVAIPDAVCHRRRRCCLAFTVSSSSSSLSSQSSLSSRSSSLSSSSSSLSYQRHPNNKLHRAAKRLANLPSKDAVTLIQSKAPRSTFLRDEFHGLTLESRLYRFWALKGFRRQNPFHHAGRTNEGNANKRLTNEVKKPTK